MSLTRQGLRSIDATSKQKTFGEVDQLPYRYQAKGLGKSNQLLSVTDGQADKTYLAGEFKDGTSQEHKYVYDGAGNLQKDSNKGITQVLYNHVNLPQVEFGAVRFIRYVSDASGVKRRKVSQDSTGSTPKVTDYMGHGLRGEPVAVHSHDGRTGLPPEQTGEASFATSTTTPITWATSGWPFASRRPSLLRPP